MTAMKVSSWVIYTLSLILITAGCSTVSSTKNRGNAAAPNSNVAGRSERSTQKVDACSLLTKADAESLLGEAVGEPATTHTEAMGNTVTQCRFTTLRGNKRVGLLTRQTSTAIDAAQIFQQARSSANELSGAQPQIIDGLGDSAYWLGGSLKQLNMLKGETWLIITVSPGNGTDPLEASKSVSLKILARMF